MHYDEQGEEERMSKVKIGDLWRTPREIIDWVQGRFGEIKIDLCSSDENKVCYFNLTESDNFLDDKWLDDYLIEMGELAWCNPPYSNPKPFVEQCIKWSMFGHGVAIILNYDTSTRWYELVEENAAVIMPITGGRVAFIGPEGKPVKGNSKPQFMCYFAPFGRATKEPVFEPVKHSEIFGN